MCVYTHTHLIRPVLQSVAINPVIIFVEGAVKRGYNKNGGSVIINSFPFSLFAKTGCNKKRGQ